MAKGLLTLRLVFKRLNLTGQEHIFKQKKCIKIKHIIIKLINYILYIYNIITVILYINYTVIPVIIKIITENNENYKKKVKWSDSLKII